MLVKDIIEPSTLVHVPIDAVLDLLWRKSIEVIGLALHWAQSRILEEDPAVHFVLLSGAVGIRDLMVFIVLLRKVLEDAARFE